MATPRRSLVLMLKEVKGLNIIALSIESKMKIIEMSDNNNNIIMFLHDIVQSNSWMGWKGPNNYGQCYPNFLLTQVLNYPRSQRGLPLG